MRCIKMKTPFVLAVISILLSISTSSCFFTHTVIKPINLPQIRESNDFNIDKTSKVHLQDGSLIIFYHGFQIRDGKLIGHGNKYDFTRQQCIQVSEVDIQEIRKVFYYKKKLQKLPMFFCVPSLLLSYLAIIEWSQN